MLQIYRKVLAFLVICLVCSSFSCYASGKSDTTEERFNFEGIMGNVDDEQKRPDTTNKTFLDEYFEDGFDEARTQEEQRKVKEQKELLDSLDFSTPHQTPSLVDEVVDTFANAKNVDFQPDRPVLDNPVEEADSSLSLMNKVLIGIGVLCLFAMSFLAEKVWRRMSKRRQERVHNSDVSDS